MIQWLPSLPKVGLNYGLIIPCGFEFLLRPRALFNLIQPDSQVSDLRIW